MKKRILLLIITITFYTSITPFRTYKQNCPVADFYYKNHTQQTLDFVLAKKEEYQQKLRNGKRMGIWQALQKLNSIIDDSDPDTQLAQIQHALQTAERLRNDNQPRWLILTGLIHDLGKLLVTYGEPQWAVVGDTFPVGCAYQKSIIYYDFFKDNPDWNSQILQTTYGIYSPHCGLEKVHLSFGHDEYLYYVVKDYLPQEALYIIRYHSFYAQHQHNAYDHLLNEHDKEMFYWVKLFQPYDLYSKDAAIVDINSVSRYYQELIAEFFPDEILW
jgi:inositol oxygenase